MIQIGWRSRRWQRYWERGKRDRDITRVVLEIFKKSTEKSTEIRIEKGPLDMATWILVVTLIVVLVQWWGEHQNEWRGNGYTIGRSVNWYNYSRKSWTFSSKAEWCTYSMIQPFKVHILEQWFSQCGLDYPGGRSGGQGAKTIILVRCYLLLLPPFSQECRMEFSRYQTGWTQKQIWESSCLLLSNTVKRFTKI